MFEARLALSQTHNLLMDGHWQSASLRKIIAAELSPYAHGADNLRCALDGDDILIYLSSFGGTRLVWINLKSAAPKGAHVSHAVALW